MGVEFGIERVGELESGREYYPNPQPLNPNTFLKILTYYK
jgi:hypothetical protein